MHRAGAASPGESLAETNKVIPNSFRVFFVAVRGAETASLREELQPTETLQRTGGGSAKAFFRCPSSTRPFKKPFIKLSSCTEI